MVLQKQLLGCNPQQVEQYLAEEEKREAGELARIISDIHSGQMKNQQRITELGILLQQYDQIQEQEQALIAQFLMQVKELESIRIEAIQIRNAAQLDFSAKLDELSNAYHMIDNIKSVLAHSYKELAHLKQL